MRAVTESGQFAKLWGMPADVLRDVDGALLSVLWAASYATRPAQRLAAGHR